MNHQNNVWILFKVNYNDTDVLIVNFEQNSYIGLVFPLLNLNKLMPVK